MDHSEEARRVRRWRSVAEKRQIVRSTLESEASVALVARAHVLNANPVFKWRRAFEHGELVDSAESSIALHPVTIGALSDVARAECRTQQQSATFGSIHTEFPVRAMISVESGADPALLRPILESLILPERASEERSELLVSSISNDCIGMSHGRSPSISRHGSVVILFRQMRHNAMRYHTVV